MTNRRQPFVINLLQMLSTHFGPINCLVNYVSQSSRQTYIYRCNTTSLRLATRFREEFRMPLDGAGFRLYGNVSEFAFFSRSKQGSRDRNYCNISILKTMDNKMGLYFRDWTVLGEIRLRVIINDEFPEMGACYEYLHKQIMHSFCVLVYNQSPTTVSKS